jgi:uracil-DNA glycosylase family 4
MAVQDLFQHIRDDRPEHEELNAQFPFYPLNSPGMSLPGPDFERVARLLGDDPPFIKERDGRKWQVTGFGKHLHYLYRRALYDDTFQLSVMVKGREKDAPFVPGHYLTEDAFDCNGGPRQAKVMIIGKHPGHEEVQARRNFVGPTSTDLFEALDTLGVDEGERAEWYITNLVKFPQLDRQSDGLPTAWIRDCLPLLDQELRLCRPDYILCLGSHASKVLLGTHAAVTNMVGRVETLMFPITDPGEEKRYHTAKVMAAVHPAAVYRRPEMFEGFKDQLGLFVQLTHGADVGAAERDIDHQVVYKHRQLKRIVDEIRADRSRWKIAIDAEWHGDYPTEPGAYLRTIQFSTRHGEGITVVLRHQHGHPAFQPSIQHALDELNRLFKADEAAGYRPRVGGWFLRADMPWLLYNGIDCRQEFMCTGVESEAREGGFAADLQYHAVQESASYKLEDVATRLTTVPRYDKKLYHWREQYCAANKLSSKDLEGYGACPDWVLHPYACYDPDATLRIAERCSEQGGLLDHDYYGNNSWLPYWVAHRATPGFLEMEMNGIMLDKDRVDKLTQQYMTVRNRLIQDFRQKINWPTFNPDSSKQCCALLFGDQYAYRIDNHGQRISIRPPGAATLNLTPVKTTGKRSKPWSLVLSRGEASQYTPSTDKETLGIIGHEHPLAMQLRDIKFISQVLKLVLRPPAVDEQGVHVMDDDGNFVYERGLASFLHADGRIRTHLSQHKETGRASSYRPPLQNISKRREDDYSRILGTVVEKDGVMVAEGDYTHIYDPMYENPIRTIFRAAPGYVLVEADYTGAELAVIAWLSNDRNMIDHVARNSLPSSDPRHYDIHSQTAVRAFALQCPPTKKGLKEAGKKGLRVAAKNVNFGIPYGRMAPAIARQCREEGVQVSIDETQRLIDMYFDTYQGTVEFLAECRQRVQDPQWLRTVFGRYRRFIASHDRMVVGEQERQAQNFPIQGTVADAVSRAVDNLYYYRFEVDIMYRLLLQIHDAVLFEVPIHQLRAFVEGENGQPSVLQECMINRVPIWPTFLDGTRRTDVTEPYHFGIDYDVQLNWGEDITEDQAKELGIPLDLI